jgi:hypothetical protein
MVQTGVEIRGVGEGYSSPAWEMVHERVELGFVAAFSSGRRRVLPENQGDLCVSWTHSSPQNGQDTAGATRRTRVAAERPRYVVYKPPEGAAVSACLLA